MRTLTPTRTTTRTSTAFLAAAGLAAAAGFISMSSAPIGPQLNVQSSASVVVSSTVVGSDNVPVLGLDLRTNRGGSLVTGLTFLVTGDSDGVLPPQNYVASAEDRFTSCEIHSSTGAVVGGPEPVTGSTLTFSGLSLASGTRVTTYTVVCDLSSVALTDKDTDAFAFSLENEASVTASTVTGKPMTGRSLNVGGTRDAGVNVNMDTSLTVLESGTLAIEQSPDDIGSTIARTGSVVGRWRFTANGEAFNVNEISLENSNASGAEPTLELQCPNDTLGTFTTTARVSGDQVRFTADCDIPNDSNGEDISVYVVGNSVAEGDATSGDAITLSMDLTGSNFEAVGLSSGVTLSGSDYTTSIESNRHEFRAGEPMFTLASGSPSSIPGVGEVMRFNIEALDNDLKVERITFTVVATDNSGTNWYGCGDGTDLLLGDSGRWNLYDATDLSSPVASGSDWTLYGPSGTACVASSTSATTYAVIDLSTPLEIPGNSASTYLLKLDTTGADATADDTLQISIPEGSVPIATTGGTTILWSDGYETSISGSGLQALPVTGEIIVY